MEKIIIKKDKIIIGNSELVPPFNRRDVDEILGKAEIHEIENNDKNYHRTISVWNNYGIAGYLSDDLNTYDTFSIKISEGEFFNNLINGFFNGRIYIDNKLYNECKWKEDLIFSHILKKGCFELSTFIVDRINEVPEKYKEDAIKASRVIEISYIKPKVKHAKFKIEKLSEPVLKFSDFNFKLAVMQVLMYEKNLLNPKFDIYEFVEEFDKRKIDIDEEGYEPIEEVIDWFKKLEIPVSLASYVEEIVMDGGNEIYTQIIPFWDGEDDYFDIKDISENEIRQFPKLKRISLLASNDKNNIIDKFKEYGIKVDEL